MEFLWFLSKLRTPFLDKLLQFITYFGQESLILPLICVFYWCLNKRFAYPLALIYFTAGLLVQSLKITFRIPRPWVLDSSFPPVESAVSGASGYSFPSGHTQGATCLFLSLTFVAHPWLFKCLSVCAFLLVGFSRMYLERIYIRFHTQTKTWQGQLLKLLVGIIVAALLKEGLPLLIGTSPLANMSKYFILVLWVIAIYPFCFHQITKKIREELL